jgi:hypothetical protein
MSEDKQAQAEVWIRKKPRHIIQNQTLIQLLIILSIATPMPLAGVMFWLVFSIASASAIVVPSIFVVWVVGSVSFIVMRLHVERQNRKKAKSYKKKM